MRRRAGAVVGLVLLASVPWLSGCVSCSGTYYEIAAGAPGEPTPEAAVALWLQSAPDDYHTDPGAWEPSGSDPMRYSDGRGQVTLMGPNAYTTGYFVTEASTCA